MAKRTALPLLAEFGEGQWGMVTTAQAAGQEITTTELGRLVQAGLLESVTRGVYRLPGVAPDRLEMEKAAWLRLDPRRPAWKRQPLDADGGVISHRSAAAIHGIGDLITRGVEITVPRRRTTREPNVHLRRGQLSADDTTRLDGLPVTTIERTIVDLLADHIDGGHVGDVIADAYQQNVLDVDALASRITPYAVPYGVRGQDGSALLDALTTQAGRGPLSTLTRARELLQMSPELRNELAKLATVIGPAHEKINQMMTEELWEKLAAFKPVQELIGRLVAEQLQQALAGSLQKQIAALARAIQYGPDPTSGPKAIDMKPIATAIRNTKLAHASDDATKTLARDE